MDIWLQQIKDIDKMPYYLNRLGELSIEDNNIVLNYNSGTTTSSGTTSGDTSNKALGAGFTIQDGDGAGNDVHFQIGKLNTVDSIGINDYSGDVGYNNLGFVTELNDIVIRNSDLNDLDGSRVLAEGDILDGGSNYSETKRNVRILNKTSISNPSVEDLLPGEIFVNVSEGKIFTLKSSQDGNYEVVQFIGNVLQENVELAESASLDSSITTNNSNRVIAMTKIENNADSNSICNLHHFYNTPSDTMKPVSWNINSATVPAKISFTAPENGNVRVVMRTYLQDGGGTSESFVGLHDTFEDTKSPSEGWYQIVKESEKNEHDLENIEFLLEGLTPGQSYTYYFVAVTTQSSGVAFLAGRTSSSDWSNIDLAKPTTITAYDMGDVSIVTNPTV
jgi:hypothetical protein